MSSSSLPNSESTLNMPKLCDDGRNWADYKPRIQVVMEAKGLWKHVEGKATSPKLYRKVNSVAILADGKTPTMEEQLDTRERRIEDFSKSSSLVKHVIFSTTSAWLGMKIKLLSTTKEMWDKVVKDTTTKSTLFLVDAEHQLKSM